MSDERAICRECGDQLPGRGIADPERRFCTSCMDTRTAPMDLTLERRDVETLQELAVARAAAAESSEKAALMGFGSDRFRRPADALRRALEAR